MDSIVTFELIDLSQSPWGILSQGNKPMPIVWLTEYDPIAKVEASHFTLADLNRIRLYANAGIIRVEGLPSEEEAPTRPIYPQPISTEVPIFDANALLNVGDADETDGGERLGLRRSKTEAFLDRNANEVKEELKMLAKRDASVAFFTDCRKLEIEGKQRKTVLSLLTRIISAKVEHANNPDPKMKPGARRKLEDSYYDAIEIGKGDDYPPGMGLHILSATVGDD